MTLLAIKALIDGQEVMLAPEDVILLLDEERRNRMAPLHIMHPHPHTEMVPIPLVLYITEDLMADTGHSAEDIAAVLAGDVAYGVQQQRDEMKQATQ